MIAVSKLCPHCEEVLPPEAFHKHKSGEDGLRSWCKNCRSKSEKERILNDSEYREHKNKLHRERLKIPAVKKKNKASCQAWYLHNKHLLIDLKINGCAICGYNEYVDICQFHHVAEKKYKINLATLSRKDFIEEFHKCILLCPNCHAEIHLKERGALNE